MSYQLKKYAPGICLLIVFIVAGMYIYQDYGIAWDEVTQMEIGNVNYNYVFKNDPQLFSFKDRDYGVGFELPLIIIEKALHIDNSRDIFLLRHIVTHLFFIVCMFSGYILSLKLFKNQLIACMTFVMLVLNPRLFGHSFVNTKDIPALSVFLLTLAAAAWAFNRKNIISFLVFGVICAFSVSIRLMNMAILPAIALFFLIDIISAWKNKQKPGYTFLCSLVFAASFFICLYAFWPILWQHPVDSLISNYENFSHFRWPGKLLLSGNIYSAAKLPGAYIPTWFFITVPEVWIALGLCGIAFFTYHFFQQPARYLSNTRERNILLYIFCCIAPVFLVIKLGSVLYDDWRHLYFIYPSFVLLAAYALSELNKTRYAKVYITVWMLQLLLVLHFSIKNHPYQYVYFNNMVSHEKNALMENYELDYWGISGKDGLEWLLEHSDDDDTIKINYTPFADRNVRLLTPAKKKRFEIVDDEREAEYYFEIFRTVPYKYSENECMYQITVSNSPILRITKQK